MRLPPGRVSTEDDLEHTLSRCHLFKALEGAATLPVGRLAEAAGAAAPPTATRILDSPERAGTVRRSHSSDDRRVVEAALTEEGRGLVSKKRRAVERARRAMFERLEGGEREQPERLLLRLADAVESSSDEAAGLPALAAGDAARLRRRDARHARRGAQPDDHLDGAAGDRRRPRRL